MDSYPAPTERDALALDASDTEGSLREEFLLPPYGDGQIAYFAGNSLGLQPAALAERLGEELADWAQLGVEGHLEARRPWVSYHELLREPAARLVGARPHEVVMMNSLTVNLHLLMASFYRPEGDRTRIVIEDTTFPSDSYAVRSQAAWHGLDPDKTVVRLKPRAGEDNLRSEDVAAFLEEEGSTVALVLLGAVNYYSGEHLDLELITRAGHAAGAIVAFDLAHAAGNVELKLHEWGVDWAAWCTYKYVNSAPGAVAGAYVHERHLQDRSIPRLEGWWSTDPSVRFQMAPEVTPQATADAWSMSNPPILAMAPVLLSLEIFDRVGMATLRRRSQRLTGYLESLLDTLGASHFEVITPRDPARRGCQLSVRSHRIDVGELAETLRRDFGVIADARQPDVIRLAPVPLYSTYHDCWRAYDALRRIQESS
ncbi:kynureninase [Nocardioides kongjuensis]|uniref:Kynureninase n=1 Tax=Nocardioides kongjuensis TaxID=349522 RepID=A0A852REE4_9ACTN|nr:kynureninase [Nocardioides kongjuensis]NYD31637.1 kynureninase [Nocardioides kongjuensis]